MKYFYLALFLGLVSCNGVYVYGTSDTETIFVEEKERVQNGNNSKYLVFTENEVFENTDSWLRLKFNSSDVYRDLKLGETYTVNVYGWRVPFFSMYRNIVSIEK